MSLLDDLWNTISDAGQTITDIISPTPIQTPPPPASQPVTTPPQPISTTPPYFGLPTTPSIEEIAPTPAPTYTSAPVPVATTQPAPISSYIPILQTPTLESIAPAPSLIPTYPSVPTPINPSYAPVYLAQPSSPSVPSITGGYNIGRTGIVSASLSNIPVTPLNQYLTAPVSNALYGLTSWLNKQTDSYQGFLSKPSGIAGEVVTDFQALGRGIIHGVESIPQMGGMIAQGSEFIAREPALATSIIPAGLGLMAGGMVKGFKEKPIETAGEFIGQAIGLKGLEMGFNYAKPTIRSSISAIPTEKMFGTTTGDLGTSLRNTFPEGTKAPPSLTMNGMFGSRVGKVVNSVLNTPSEIKIGVGQVMSQAPSKMFGTTRESLSISLRQNFPEGKTPLPELNARAMFGRGYREPLKEFMGREPPNSLSAPSLKTMFGQTREIRTENLRDISFKAKTSKMEWQASEDYLNAGRMDLFEKHNPVPEPQTDFARTVNLETDLIRQNPNIGIPTEWYGKSSRIGYGEDYSNIGIGGTRSRIVLGSDIISRSSIPEEPTTSVPRELYPYGRSSKLYDRISTPDEELVNIPRGGKVKTIGVGSISKPSGEILTGETSLKGFTKNIPKPAIEPIGISIGKVTVRENIGARLKARWEKEAQLIAKKPQTDVQVSKNQTAISIMEKPTTVNETKAMQIQDRILKQASLTRTVQTEQIKQPLFVGGIFSKPKHILSSVLGAGAVSVSSLRNNLAQKTDAQQIQNSIYVPVSIQNPVQIPKEVSIQNPIYVPVQNPIQIPKEVPVQTPVFIPTQVPEQTAIQIPKYIQKSVLSTRGSMLPVFDVNEPKPKRMFKFTEPKSLKRRGKTTPNFGWHIRNELPTFASLFGRMPKP